MKTLFRLTYMALFVLLFSSCSKEEPETVAVNFVQAFYTGNMDKALSFCHGEALVQITDYYENISEFKDRLSKEKPIAEVVSTDVSKSGTTALVTIKVNNYFDVRSKHVITQAVEDKLKFEDIDGKWMIVSTPYVRVESADTSAVIVEVNSLARKFLEAFYIGDFKGASTMCSEKTVEMLKELKENFAPLIPQMQECQPEIEISNTEISGDGMAAKVKVRSRNYFNPNKQKVISDWDADEVDMVFVDDRWIVIKQ